MEDHKDIRSRQIRKGDVLRVEYLRDLGPSFAAALQRIKRVHDAGGYIVETTTGLRSDKHLPDMLIAAMPKLRKGLLPRVAAKNGAKGGRRPNEHTPVEVAKPVWTDLEIASNKRALRMPEMRGWYLRLAYEVLGPSGRPRNKPKRKRK